MNLVSIPTSPIERLTERVRNVLYLPDPSPLYLLMGAVAANIIKGPPVWMLFVGPPSCGKSELLNCLLDVPRVVEMADIASEAAFLSGSPVKDVRKDSTGGILRQTGSHGALIINDFTSILSKPTEKLLSIMAVLREAYGGRWTRHIGGEGGREISWAGKLAVFGGCTSKIDQYHQISAELGERWIYYRYVDRDTFHELSLALEADRGDWRAYLRHVISEFLTEQCLTFTSAIERRPFLTCERVRIHQMAQVAVRCRSAVARDKLTREILAPTECELTPRIGAVLGQLYVGLEHIGVTEAMRWKLLHRIVLDSMPRLRRMIVEALRQGPQTVEQLQIQTGCGVGVVKRIIEDMELYGLLHVDGRMAYESLWMRNHYQPSKWVSPGRNQLKFVS